MLRLIVNTLLMMAYSGLSLVSAEIVYRAPESALDLRTEYFVSLLDLALQETATASNKLAARPSDNVVSQDRAFSLVKNGTYIDIVWGMTNPERETELAPIRIPLLKGLLGCRVAIVRHDRLHEFRNIVDLDTLKNYTIIQGTGWPDVDILRSSGLQVITSSDYDGMFAMIASGRADMFFRGVTEAWVEIETVPYPNLTVDTNILLTYQGPIYFFVNRESKDLAERISTGLKAALASGKFDEVVNNHPYVIQARAELAKNNRRLIPLSNPLLPSQTPLSDPTLWMELQVGSDTVRCIDE
jgi:ABC-type amino acid transport substrate-binding protein